jgi:hypothetical protein
MEGILELGIIMVLIACFAFAPLGYFIYRYVAKNGEPFGDIEPHGDNESAVLKAVEKVYGLVKSQLKK